MAIVFITGSTDGLGRAAAQSLLDDGHQVVLHARSTGRAATIAELASRSEGIVVGDLRNAAEVRSIADQVNAMGRMDAIIHNAGVYTERSRSSAPEGHAGTLRGKHPGAVHVDGTDRAPRSAGVPEQRAAPRRRGFTERP